SCGAPTFTNVGLWRKSSGTGQFQFVSCLTLTNTGTVEVQSGAVSIGAPATLSTSGHLTVAGGATFYLANVTLQNGSTFSGTGTLSMNGTTTVTGDVTLTVPAVLVNTVTGTGPLHMAAPMTWTGGVMAVSGGMEVLPGKSLSIETGNQHVLSGPLTNHGSVVW